MAEETSGDAATAAEAGTEGDSNTHPPFTLSGQYIRDFSFEVPKAPQIFALMQDNPPDIKLNVDVQVQPLQEKLYEVVLKVEANCTVKETPAFILEISYGGLFNVNVGQDWLHHTLLAECPKLLFPFVRHLIADTTREGGFPPLMMGLVDFDAMYLGEIKRLQAEQAAAGEDSADGPEGPAKT